MRKGFVSRIALLFLSASLLVLSSCGQGGGTRPQSSDAHRYNGPYAGDALNRVAFPIGGMGAGMICLEGTGAISHVSVRNRMNVFSEPCSFASLCIKGEKNTAKVLEGPVPAWKIFGTPGTGNGAARTSFGFPRFDTASFQARFPFGTVTLSDSEMPVEAEITGWSPFTPGDADNSSLPAGALEFRFKNTSRSPVEAVFSYNTVNFMAIGNEGNTILPVKNGFILSQKATKDHPEYEGSYAVFTDDDRTVVDHCWFKGGWWDSLTLAWENIANGRLVDNPPVAGSCPGASLFVPVSLSPGEEKTVRVMIAWYVPVTDIKFGADPEGAVMKKCDDPDCTGACATGTFRPWYAKHFASIGDVADYWRLRYDDLRAKTALFTDTFYDTSLPPEVVEAVAANLTILKSPTVLRQCDGRLWCFEGCSDMGGCCHGTCTHVWNYAQAIPHLFPDLERSLRSTEFTVSQDEKGHQTFRTNLPIRQTTHTFHAASDGQLGGIMKVYREWRISGDTEWLRGLWPNVKQSLDYSIATWDPRGKGVLEEPHHNTYDIEYWGPDGHCSSFYLGALTAAIDMGGALGEDVARYGELLGKGKAFMESELWNGEYFFQKIQTEGLNAKFTPIDASNNGAGYADMINKLNTQGPKYQYGTGCLSDGVLGFWIARVCGLGEIVDTAKVKRNLESIYTYNLMRDLSDFANPQRPSYAMGHEGGLLLCTWPHGGELSIPFVYSNEVWTGIEYQVASHLMMEGMVDKGLDIVRTCRDRYDGRVRNPFNEYECGHWYARAMSSYGLLQGLTGVRFDAVDKTLYIDSQVGDFRSFLATANGFGSVGLKNGKPFLDVRQGRIEPSKVIVSGKETAL